MTPIQLHLPNGQPTEVYFCSKCRVVGTERAAQLCCTPPLCDKCQCELPRGWVRCNKCRLAAGDAIELARFTKAIKLTAWDGPVFCEGRGYNDGFFANLQELLDSMDEDDTAPAYVWACTTTRFVSIDMGNIVGCFIDRSPKNWDDGDLNGVPELTAALEAFCEANRDAVRWDPDYSRCVVLTGGAA